MVEFTKEDKKIYGMYTLLRKYAPNANITTLRQISLYVGISTGDFDVNNDCSIFLNENIKSYEIVLKDGRKIFFSDALNNFSFTVFKEDRNIFMSMNVYEVMPGDLSTVNVYGEIRTKNDGMFVVSFRPVDMTDDSLKYGTINYYSEEEINWIYEISGEKNIERDFDVVAKRNLIYPFAEKSYFDVDFKSDSSELDCYDGYLSAVLTRIDLLYENTKICVDAKIKKKSL